MADAAACDKTFPMKIEVFILPRNGEVRVAPSPAVDPAPAADEKFQPQQTSVRRIPWQVTIWIPVLACILIACGGAAYAAFKAISAMNELSLQRTSDMASQNPSASSAGTSTTEEKSRVQHFDNSQALRRGDVVVVRDDGGANVGQVALAANSTGLLKRGNVLEALYVLGEDRYLVKSEAGTQIVRGNNIFATVAAAQQH